MSLFSKRDRSAAKSESFNDLPKKKKISFFAAMMIAMGSSIGAGIFFKSQTVLSQSSGSVIFSLVSWVIAAFSVMAMGMALVEVASARNDNLSYVGWVKTFNSRMNFKACKNYLFYIYLPLNYFVMPLYAIQSLQQGIGVLINGIVTTPGPDFGNNVNATFGTNFDWVIWSLIGLAIVGYFIFTAGYWARVGSAQNNLMLYVKFFPLLVIPIVGFTILGLGNGQPLQPGFSQPSDFSISNGDSVASFSAGIGLFLSLGAIYFAYDGFYVAAGAQTEMKEPKKTPWAILLGLGITTLLYLLIALAMSISSTNGGITTMGGMMYTTFGNAGVILYGVINLAIAFGILGIINGFAIWMPRMTEDLIARGELPFSIRYKNRLDPHKPLVGIMYNYAITIPIYIIFCIIGGLGYINTSGYGFFGSGMQSLYSFCDLNSTWTSVGAFAFISIAIFGALRNRKTEKVKTMQTKGFVPLGWIAVFLVMASVVFTIAVPIFDFLLIGQLNKTQVEANGLVFSDVIVSRVMTIVTLIIYVALSYGLVPFVDRKNIKHHGSMKKYDEWKSANFLRT